VSGNNPPCAKKKLAARGPELSRKGGWHRPLFASGAVVEWALLSETHEYKMIEIKTQLGFVSHRLNCTSEGCRSGLYKDGRKWMA
jgi:hypothetical protein